MLMMMMTMMMVDTFTGCCRLRIFLLRLKYQTRCGKHLGQHLNQDKNEKQAATCLKAKTTVGMKVSNKS